MDAVEEGHVLSDHVGHRHEQVRRPDHHLDRLVRVAEHGDGRHARERVLATGERARLAVRLERRHDLLGHLLEVRHLVEADGVPDPDQPHLAAGHVEEQVGDGRGAGEQDRVRREFLIAVALPGFPWAEFDEVVVGLGQRDQAGQVMQLLAAVEVRRFEADGPQEQVDPLVGRELAAALPVLFEVERGELDRLQPLDPEGAPLPGHLFVILVLDVHLRPDPAPQQAVELPQVVLGDVDELVPEVLEFGPVLVVVGDVADLHLVDESVLALILHHRLGLVRLVGPHEVRRQRGVDHPHPGVDGHRVVGGAELPEQVFEDENRHVGTDLHLAHEILADHLACEHRRRFFVQLRHDTPQKNSHR